MSLVSSTIGSANLAVVPIFCNVFYTNYLTFLLVSYLLAFGSAVEFPMRLESSYYLKEPSTLEATFKIDYALSGFYLNVVLILSVIFPKTLTAESSVLTSNVSGIAVTLFKVDKIV